MNGENGTELNQNNREENENSSREPNQTSNDGATGNLPGATGLELEVLQLRQEVADYKRQCASQLGTFRCIEELVGPELMNDFMKARGRMSDRIKELAGSGRGEMNDDCDGAKGGDESKRKDESVKPP